MASFKEKVEFEDVKAIRETVLALYCLIDGRGVWIPQSQIDDNSEIWEAGDEGTLIISQWIAEQKGLV